MAGLLHLRGRTLSINLLPMTLVNVPNAVEFLLAEIEASGLIPEQIIVEFTESEAISRLDEFTDSVRKLKSAGIRVAIDHFGAGFAGLLRELTPTTALFDFNHPLAGQSLAFEVKIIGIL